MKNLNSHITHHLKNLNINPGDHILLYSKISSFGILKKDFAKILLKIILKYIGPNGTVVMPSYTFEKKNYVFKLHKLQKNYSTSVLIKEFFKNKKIIRSFRPIHSHIGIGKKSYLLKRKIDQSRSFGKNSDFDLLTKNNFKCIYLGCTPLEAGTYLIHIEYLNKVPYRKKIIIKKKIFKKNTIKIINVKYFDKPKIIEYDFDKAFFKLAKFGANIKKVKLKFGYSLSISLKDFYKYGNIMFKKNKYCLLKNVLQKQI